ncbi:MAG: hypothetical protein KIT72_02135 [Polyangiaceae bacterium]|nr:hypothetical protein [Polyangiaceae bacterium]
MYDELTERATEPPWSTRCQQLRAELVARCGGFEPDHPAAAARDAASLEHALVAGGLARAIGAELHDPSERAEALAIAGAIPALLLMEDHAGLLVAHDVWSGAAWWIAPGDDVGRDLRPQLRDPPLVQCRLVVTDAGAALLPGVVFHAADAVETIQHTLARAAELQLSTAQVFEALLRMEHRFHSHTRIKVSYAYRAEVLSG